MDRQRDLGGERPRPGRWAERQGAWPDKPLRVSGQRSVVTGTSAKVSRSQDGAETDLGNDSGLAARQMVRTPDGDCRLHHEAGMNMPVSPGAASSLVTPDPLVLGMRCLHQRVSALSRTPLCLVDRSQVSQDALWTSGTGQASQSVQGPARWNTDRAASRCQRPPLLGISSKDAAKAVSSQLTAAALRGQAWRHARTVLRSSLRNNDNHD